MRPFGFLVMLITLKHRRPPAYITRLTVPPISRCRCGTGHRTPRDCPTFAKPGPLQCHGRRIWSITTASADVCSRMVTIMARAASFACAIKFLMGANGVSSI
jgi:hypothetical protein